MDLKQFKSDAAATQAPAAPTKTANNYGYPTEGGSGVNATVLGAHWFYQLAEEFNNVLQGSYTSQTGTITPSVNSLTQLRDSINRLITQGISNGAIGTSNIADGSITKSKLRLNSHKFEYSVTGYTNTIRTILLDFKNDSYAVDYSNYFIGIPKITNFSCRRNKFLILNQGFFCSSQYNESILINISVPNDVDVNNNTEPAEFTLTVDFIEII